MTKTVSMAVPRKVAVAAIERGEGGSDAVVRGWHGRGNGAGDEGGAPGPVSRNGWQKARQNAGHAGNAAMESHEENG